MAEEIRADYEKLKTVATRFSKESHQVNDTLGKIRRSMQALKPAWAGRGSAAFFKEMEEEVLPALTRLKEALQEGSDTTKKISAHVKKSEEEAASLFKQV